MPIKRRSTYASDGEEPVINLTPLIDVVFVVLIIFILIAPMLDVDKVQLASGKTTEQSPATEAHTIAIHVREDNSIWMQNVRIAPEQLLPLLLQEKRKHPDYIPQLFHDKRAQFGTYQLIKNAVESAGFQEMDVLLQPG